ncbi:MAG: endonuclease/exonuclease/phosphatase family protein [Saprospiraceae bacterium]|nr:endonuclease/exonuclease/phosphatase family protein [Saprospiraceae bacterium]
MKWFLRVMLWSNWAVVILTTIGYLASYIDPEQNSIPQAVGLFMPWLLLFNVLYFIFWISIRRRWFALSLICIVLGFGQMTRFLGFHFSKHSDPAQIGICSFNSQSYNESDHLNGFLKEIKGQYQLDFICLQEITENHILSLKKTTGLDHHYFYKGKAILSRFPIEAQGNIQFDQSVNGCIWIDILLQGHKVRIYDLHLKSNQVTHEAETVLEDINSDRAKALTNIRRMVTNYRRNSMVRKEQVLTILKNLDHTDYPIILAGDFNDTPFSYTYQQFSDRLIDQFKKKGLGIGSTYAGAVPGLKIDYIFADEFFEALDHQILKGAAISDHFPVLSLMKIKE